MPSASKTLLASAFLGLAAIKGTVAYSATSSWYWPETGNQGACGGFIKNGDWVIALDARHYDRGGVCNKMVRITANGKTQTARIGNRCEMCRSTDGIDMTPELFSAFADRGVGIIDVTWEFADGSGGGGGNQNEWKPEPKPEPPKPEWTSPKPEWTPPKEEWKPPATTSKKSEPAWTPPAWTPSKSEPAWTPPAWTPEESPAPSPTPSQRQNANNFENNQSSSSSNQTYSSSATVSESNSTIGANVTATQNSTIASTEAASVLPSVMVSIPGQRKETATIARNGLAHLHQAVLQVASLVVEAAVTV